MKKIIILSAFLFVKTFFSQSILMTVNKDTIYTPNFEKQQKKSLELIGVKQTIHNFVDFNLLKQYALGYKVDKSPNYELELIKEGEKLKDSLYYRPEIVNPLLADYYQKIMKERKVQILLFKEGVLPKDLKTQEKFIKSVIKKINNNTLNFGEAVEKYSLMQDFKNPKYFDIFTINKFLLDEIYRAPLNKVSEFNIMNQYHYLIFVSNERQYLGEVFLDEIVVKDTSENGKIKAETIYKEIGNADNFSDIKKKYTEANGTSRDIFKIIQDEKLYKDILETNQLRVFQPVKTDEGYKIYLFLNREDYINYSKIKKRLYNRFINSIDASVLEDDLISELKGSPFYKEDRLGIGNFYNSLPKTYKEFQNLELSKEVVLIDIDDQFKLTNKDLLEQIKSTNEKDYPNIRLAAEFYVDSWERKQLLEYYKIYYFKLDRFHDEWENLKDRILIKAALSIITDKALQDKEGQKKFLEKESEKYTWKERINGTYYYCLNSEVEKEVLQMLGDKKSMEYIQNYFKGKTDTNNNQLLVINQGKYTREALNLPLNEKLSKKVYTTNYKARKLVIDIKEIQENDKMSLEEFQTLYVNEYVDYKIGEVMKQLKKDAVINIDKAQQEILEKNYSL